jgi:hypothetical protein
MANQESDKVVTITLDASGLPVPNMDPIPVKKDKQKIRWCAAFPFTIDIDGYTDVKHGTSGGTLPHDAKTGTFKTQKLHKYSITANGKTNDPDIDVQP